MTVKPSAVGRLGKTASRDRPRSAAHPIQVSTDLKVSARPTHGHPRYALRGSFSEGGASDGRAGRRYSSRGRCRGHLRASHADREQVIDTLKAAFVQGMLAKDEFDLRVDRALASRTGAELAALTADIPAGLITAKPPAPARAQGEQPVLRPGAVIKAATAAYAGVWAYELVLSPHGVITARRLR